VSPVRLDAVRATTRSSPGRRRYGPTGHEQLFYSRVAAGGSTIRFAAPEAAGVGFEPTSDLDDHSGFQDRNDFGLTERFKSRLRQAMREAGTPLSLVSVSVIAPFRPYVSTVCCPCRTRGYAFSTTV
jgi:hypothetical protein